MKATLRRFILEGGDFEATALALYQYQRAHNRDYAAYADGAQPARWQDIPAVPVALFRDLPLTSFPAAEATVTFRTSGTTGPRGVVRLRDTELYDLGARLAAAAALGEVPQEGVSLVSHAADASLGHMCADFAPRLRRCFDPERGLDKAGAWAALRGAAAPQFVPGTAFAWDELTEGVSEACPLPVGSILMVTGGFKGRRRTVGEGELADRLRALFPGVRLVGEYGMTELCSQLWAPELGGPFFPPPWMRVRAVDPWTGEDAAVGLLRFYDLANADTAFAIETRDLGELRPDGSVVLRGRLEGDEPRGCSLTVEELQLRREVALAFPIVETALDRDDLLDPFALAVTPTLQRGDHKRVGAALRAIAALGRADPTPWAQGLSPEMAQACLALAASAITVEGLEASLAVPGARPAEITLVAAHGVFTAVLEWVALYAAAGIRVRLKAPARDPAFCAAVARAFVAEGLPVELSLDRDLGSPDAVVAFGGDETMAAIRAATPGARHALFGHRFSVALVDPRPRLARALALDLCRFDSRGCMAPAAIFVVGDPGALLDPLAQALDELSRTLPLGRRDPGLGPEWRRRMGLARARGQLREAAGEAGGAPSGWAVTTLPLELLIPSALPRMANLYRVPSAAALTEALRPWAGSLSSLATSDPLRPLRDPAWNELWSWFPRVVPVGDLQRPTLPRNHDGRSMLGCVLGPVPGPVRSPDPGRA